MGVSVRLARVERFAATGDMLYYIFLAVLLMTLEARTQIDEKDEIPDRPVRIAVLAPGNDSLPFALRKVMPAVEYAVRTLKRHNSHRIQVISRDTECSSTYGPLAAFNLYHSGLADVFLGPVCPYALAPVARYSTVWEVPVLTPAGQNEIYDQKQPHYRMLTRMNGSYSQIGLIFLQVFRKFQWQVVAFIYYNYADRTKGHSDCYFTLGAVFTTLGGKAFYKDFDENQPDTDYRKMLNEISQHARNV